MLRPLMLTIFSHPPNREGLKFFSLLILVTRLKMDPNTLLIVTAGCVTKFRDHWLTKARAHNQLKMFTLLKIAKRLHT
jgi:hypothetical protein